MRKIEVAACIFAHVVFPEELSSVDLFLPVSKADVGGCGVMQLRTCDHTTEALGRQSCAVCALRSLTGVTADLCDIDVPAPNCPWATEAWEVPLCISADLKTPEKDAVIRGWRYSDFASCSLSGHSARRSEAKELARKGWPLTLIAKLGRMGLSRAYGLRGRGSC